MTYIDNVTVSDKTGFSLTAGSYSVRASSMQRGVIQVTSAFSGTATVSSVTTTRAQCAQQGERYDTTGQDVYQQKCDLVLTNATTVTATRGGNDANSQRTSWEISEFY